MKSLYAKATKSTISSFCINSDLFGNICKRITMNFPGCAKNDRNYNGTLQILYFALCPNSDHPTDGTNATRVLS